MSDSPNWRMPVPQSIIIVSSPLLISAQVVLTPTTLLIAEGNEAINPRTSAASFKFAFCAAVSALNSLGVSGPVDFAIAWEAFGPES